MFSEVTVFGWLDADTVEDIMRVCTIRTRRLVHGVVDLSLGHCNLILFALQMSPIFRNRKSGA